MIQTVFQLIVHVMSTSSFIRVSVEQPLNFIKLHSCISSILSYNTLEVREKIKKNYKVKFSLVPIKKRITKLMNNKDHDLFDTKCDEQF